MELLDAIFQDLIPECGKINEMAALKLSCKVFLAAFFCAQVTCNLAEKETNSCSGEKSVMVGDVCFVIVQNKTTLSGAQRSCNATGGHLWKTSDRQKVFEKVKNDKNFTGFFWVDTDADITIDDVPERKICHTVEFGTYDKARGLKMTVNFYTRSFYCWRRRAFICKYDVILERKAVLNPNSSAQLHVPLFVLIIVGVIAFLLLVGLLVTLAIVFRRRRQKSHFKALYLAATSTENPEMYDAPRESHAPDTGNPRVYDFPLEVKDIKEEETLLGGAKKTREQHSWFDSFRNAAQAAVTRKNRHNDKDAKGKEQQEKKEMRLYDFKKASKKDRKTDIEHVSDVDFARNPKLSELNVIEKGKVGKVASMFEAPKNEEVDKNIPKSAARPKAKDIQQTESKTDLKDMTSKTISPRSASKSSIDEGLKQNKNAKDERHTNKKEGNKSETDSKSADNVKDKKGSVLDRVKGFKEVPAQDKEKDEKRRVKDKEKDEKGSGKTKEKDEKGRVKNKKYVNKKGKNFDIEKRKEEERQKQLELDKEIERQRNISINAHEAAHEYMYVEEDDKKNEQTEEDLYEPVLVYENEDSC